MGSKQSALNRIVMAQVNTTRQLRSEGEGQVKRRLVGYKRQWKRNLWHHCDLSVRVLNLGSAGGGGGVLERGFVVAVGGWFLF